MKAQELAKQYLALSEEEQTEFQVLIAPKEFGGTGDNDSDADDGGIGQDDPTNVNDI
jgi:hypothetical protein